MRSTAGETKGAVGRQRPSADEAGRKRAAVELIAQEGDRLRRAARRYSLCGEDAEDAYQRGIEILLTKAPTERPQELLAWTTTVVKHEALAVRRARERLLGRGPASSGDEPGEDWSMRVPSAGAGPLERVERREDIARSREAIRALKPAERRALALLAEGYSYAEIGEITGFSRTKVNRCVAEGRERFRQIVASSEDGSRCVELHPLLSTFCDAETSREQSALVREHLRACGRCRATVRAYRAAPATVAALSPLPLVVGKATGLIKLFSFGKLTGLKQAVVVCAVTGAGVGAATGVLPVPTGPGERPVAPRIDSIGPQVRARPAPAGKVPPSSGRRRLVDRDPETARGRPIDAPAPAPAPEPVEAPPPPVEAVESPPSPEPEATPTPAPAPEAGSAAGEFGP
ncbi:MAG TPA: sigma-70 family RNA polymerase sigma factor [Solirubrobacterales bacterium]|nr:sigma-70 family RNA polymerase sigma factor [Solirubrobacterales bacterium]